MVIPQVPQRELPILELIRLQVSRKLIKAMTFAVAVLVLGHASHRPGALSGAAQTAPARQAITGCDASITNGFKTCQVVIGAGAATDGEITCS